MKRLHGVALASGLLALGGCCSEVDETVCIELDDAATCPTPAELGPAFAGNSTTFRSAATLWPAHEYQIGSEHRVEPAQCCYEITHTRCQKDLF